MAQTAEERRAKDREQAHKRRAANLEQARDAERKRDRKRRAASPERRREYQRKWNAINPEKRREMNRKWRAANPEKRREMHRKWRAANPEKTLERDRKQRGLPEPTRQMSPVCECCGEHSKRTMNLDHCHVTGDFRGWLCNKCNTAIGKLGDNLAGVMRAVEYLKRTESWLEQEV